MSVTVGKTKSFGWFGLLGIIFVVCKILEIGVVATWSWWLVLLPFYLGFAIIAVIFGGAATVTGIVFVAAAILDALSRRKRRKEREKRATWDALNRK